MFCQGFERISRACTRRLQLSYDSMNSNARIIDSNADAHKGPFRAACTLRDVGVISCRGLLVG